MQMPAVFLSVTIVPRAGLGVVDGQLSACPAQLKSRVDFFMV